MNVSFTLNQLGDVAVAGAKAKGFNVNETGTEIDQKLLLIVSEIAEAQNELRMGHAPGEVYYPLLQDGPAMRPSDKPEGFGVELADAIIRIVQLGRSLGLDLDALVAEKMAYNATRPYKHGKRFLAYEGIDAVGRD